LSLALLLLGHRIMRRGGDEKRDVAETGD